MNILFISTIPRTGLSGGRYHSIIFAESLARKGFKVDYLCNNGNELLFSNDYIKKLKVRPYLSVFWGRSKLITYIIAIITGVLAKINFFSKYDKVVIVPEEGKFYLHQSLLYIAKRFSNKIYLMNFETPNWFNKYSPIKRDPKRWCGWKLIAEQCESVICISEESSIYAKEFYGESISVSYFPIPCYQNDDIVHLDWSLREDNVLCITRYDVHKGINGMVDFVSSLDGVKRLTFLSGSIQIPEALQSELYEAAALNGISLDIRSKISNKEKYILLSESKYLVFPSLFEGLGLPPIEALASGCKVAAFDLPVIKQTSKEIEFAELGDYATLAKIVSVGLSNKPSTDLKASVERFEISNIEPDRIFI